jgi:hypothetical protein
MCQRRDRFDPPWIANDPSMRARLIDAVGGTLGSVLAPSHIN